MTMDNPEVVEARGNMGMSYVINEANLIDFLNTLIATNRGMIDVYQTAVDRLENQTNIELLQGYAQQHKTFVSELSNVVAGHSGEPVTGADGGSLIKQAWVTLKAALTEGDGPIVKVVAQDADNLLKTYGEAMGEDLPDDVRDVIRKQMSQIRLAAEKLSGLSEAYNNH